MQRVKWMLEAFGVFLLVSGLRMTFTGGNEIHPERNPVVKLAGRLLPVSSEFDGHSFVTVINGRRLFTLRTQVLIAMETSDFVFTVDSVPAVFPVTQEPFLIFTWNVSAILGLRSLYFVLVGAIASFRHLKTGLVLVLAFIGVKMLVARWIVIPTALSLEFVAATFAFAVGASIAAGDGDGARQWQLAQPNRSKCNNCAKALFTSPAA